MSLYDGLGLDSAKEKEKDLAGWSSGIKLLQSQLQLKKTVLTQVKKEYRKGSVLPPVVDLKARKEDTDEIIPPVPVSFVQNRILPREATYSAVEAVVERENIRPPNASTTLFGPDPEWNVKEEYDPMWPNDYEKIIKERRDKKEKEREEDRRRDYEERERRRRERYNRDRDEDRESRRRRTTDDGDEEHEFRSKRRRDHQHRNSQGAAIAPPPSLMVEDERKEPVQPSNFTGAGFAPSLGGSVAAKIMAKYGFKEGQGLGKQEQGMSQALLVEKTSKRGGKIIHEKDIAKESLSPTEGGSGNTSTESITEAMKNPSKVVLLRNVVGPGEVDEELEPEVKEECTKYGDIMKCLIFEIPGAEEEEAVRIFVEFKRIESAIKAVVDLNGRFFGGRIVKAGFYNLDKFRRFELAD